MQFSLLAMLMSFHMLVGHLYVFKRDVCSSPLPSFKLDCLKGLEVTGVLMCFVLVPYILHSLSI